MAVEFLDQSTGGLAGRVNASTSFPFSQASAIVCPGSHLNLLRGAVEFRLEDAGGRFLRNDPLEFFTLKRCGDGPVFTRFETAKGARAAVGLVQFSVVPALQRLGLLLVFLRPLLVLLMLALFDNRLYAGDAAQEGKEPLGCLFRRAVTMPALCACAAPSARRARRGGGRGDRCAAGRVVSGGAAAVL